MTGFSTKPWDVRYGHMGDDAEALFESVRPRAQRFGLSRPAFGVWRLPLKMRYTPDYIDGDGLYEVMAVGRDGRLKLKCEKHMALVMWDSDMRTRLFVHRWADGAYGVAEIPSLTTALMAHATYGAFPDGARTWEIDVEELGVAWVPIENTQPTGRR